MKGQVELNIIDYDLWTGIEKEAMKRGIEIETSIIQLLNEKRREDKFGVNKLK